MFRCTGTKVNGSSCNNIVRCEKGTCCWHTPISSSDPHCSVCFETMTTRNSRKLETCGHTFHRKCLNTWKQQGNRTCPLCRVGFDIPEFTVTISIEPVHGNTTSFDASPSALNIFNNLELDIDNLSEHSTQLSFEADNISNLGRVLGAIGVDLSDTDLYSLVRRDAE